MADDGQPSKLDGKRFEVAIQIRNFEIELILETIDFLLGLHRVRIRRLCRPPQ